MKTKVIVSLGPLLSCALVLLAASSELAQSQRRNEERTNHRSAAPAPRSPGTPAAPSIAPRINLTPHERPPIRHSDRPITDTAPAPRFGGVQPAPNRGPLIRHFNTPHVDSGIRAAPSVVHIPRRRVHRRIDRHVAFRGAFLAVPAIVYYGVPVVLDVPQLGSVGIPEDLYPEIYDLLVSDDPADRDRALMLLRRHKLQRQPEETADDDSDEYPATTARSPGPKIITVAPAR